MKAPEDRHMVDEKDREDRVEPALADPAAEHGPWLEAAYREHAGMVLQTAYRVTGRIDDAEDVLQTVFTRLAARAVRPEFTTGCGAYLRRAASNAALDIVQSRYARSGVSLEASGSAWQRDPAPEPESRHLGRELEEQLRRALAELSRRSAEIFVLRYFEGLDNTAIASCLGTSPGTVAVTLHRAKARLREALEPYLGGLQ
jgi:RNA polymerase sigma-70 factor (ECF subfamily)